MSGRILLALGLGLSMGLVSQADDVLDRFVRENQLKAQKLVAEAKEALHDAKIMEATSLKKARELLQSYLNQLERAELKDQKALVLQFRTRITQLDGALRVQQERDQKIIDQALRDQKMRDLAQPKNPPKERPGAMADRFIGSVKDTLGSHDRFRKLQADGFIAVQNDIARTAADAFKGEDRVPARYLWALENRVNDKLTKAEKKILKGLNSVLSVDWNKIPLKEALELLQEKTDITIVVNENSLKEANLEYESEKVTLKGKKLTVRSILKKILNERGLSYIVKDEILHVITAQQARETMTTRIYPVADFVSPDPRFGPFMGQQMLLQNANSLIQMIQSTVDPTIWQNGASITFDPITRSLVVRAPAEMHLKMGFGGGGR